MASAHCRSYLPTETRQAVQTGREGLRRVDCAPRDAARVVPARTRHQAADERKLGLVPAVREEDREDNAVDGSGGKRRPGGGEEGRPGDVSDALRVAGRPGRGDGADPGAHALIVDVQLKPSLTERSCSAWL
ncbi:hypothetical protein ON010_g9515 [Phytophthora cinnamomi]|nr:hypothetical protein ON010_g9515 [Phytophthora cinnamomi]